MSNGFNYYDAVGTSNLELGGALSGSDYHAPCTLLSAFGVLLILNGVDQNRQMVDGTTTSVLYPLMGNAPYGYLSPTVSGLGTGRVYGRNYFWRYRFKSSKSGQVTGMSDVGPTPTNLGAETTPGASTVVGQNASFNLAGRGGDDGAFYDRIELIRNSSDQADVWYVVKEVANPGSGLYVLVTDDVQDEELVLNELADLKPNPSHNEGPLFPVAKAFIHPTGRVWYYGVIPMGRWTNGTFSVTDGNQYVTINQLATPSSSTDVPRFRTGQQFVPTFTSGGSAITTTQGYRVVAVGTGSEGDCDLYPAWAEGTLSTATYEIRDDRDTRTLFMSEPGLPTQVDTLKTLFVGGSRDDPLLHIFAMGGVTYAVTRRRIYRIDDDYTDDPSLSLRLSVAAEEGTAGLWSSVETPIGLVFVNPTRGVRLFDGQNVLPLGGDSPVSRSPIDTQFSNIDPNHLSHCRVFYDPDKHRVFVSYAPAGAYGLEESLVYYIESGAWRGPWRVHLTAVAPLLDDGGASRTYYGDEFGNLSLDQDSAVDVVNPLSGQAVTGTVSSVTGTVFFTATGTFDPNTDKRVVGCPIVFTSADGNTVQVNMIAGFDGTNFELLYIPTASIASNTFRIGAVRWNVRTAFLDAGEPILPKTLENLRLRFERGTSGSNPILLSAAIDGSTSYGVDSADSGTTSVSVADRVHSTGNLSRGGQAFSINLTCTANNGHPRITQAVADIAVGSGGERTP